jgi:uncharacterized protein YneF (UPF0154 family)
MKEMEPEALTEAALVARLQELGYTNVSVRTIGEWRRRELLPKFDQRARGLGRGVGKRPSVWTDGQAVIERAAWVSDLIRVYGRMESAYLPLWMRGYPITLKRVRQALRQPAAKLDQAIRKEMKRDGGLTHEDVIDDFLYKAQRGILKNNPSLSLDQVRGMYNLMFNPDYDPEELASDEFAPHKNASGGQPHTPHQSQTSSLFQYAPFIKEHLSFQREKEILRHCTVEDLKIIERDVGILREIVFHLGRIAKAAVSAAPAELTAGFTDKWHVLFFLGRKCILADLSLRRSGYDNWIDENLPLGLEMIRAMFNEEREAEIRAKSPQMIAEMERKTEDLKRQGAANAKGAAKPERRLQ